MESYAVTPATRGGSLVIVPLSGAALLQRAQAYATLQGPRRQEVAAWLSYLYLGQPCCREHRPTPRCKAGHARPGGRYRRNGHIDGLPRSRGNLRG